MDRDDRIIRFRQVCIDTGIIGFVGRLYRRAAGLIADQPQGIVGANIDVFPVGFVPNVDGIGDNRDGILLDKTWIDEARATVGDNMNLRHLFYTYDIRVQRLPAVNNVEFLFFKHNR